jgi:threonine/homoserine/homoserine lactone efflux protein
MDPFVLARGLALGFSIAAVFGPIGLLCVRRTLANGFLIGFATGLGAATADATYAAIAGFGLSSVATLLVNEQHTLRLVGGGFLLYLGVRIFRSPPATHTSEQSATGLRLVGVYSSTVALTLSNPLTILSFAAMFAGIGASGADLVLGVFVGSAAWWLVLAAVATRLRRRITTAWFGVVNRAAGVLILGFGVQSLVSATGVL